MEILSRPPRQPEVPPILRQRASVLRDGDTINIVIPPTAKQKSSLLLFAVVAIVIPPLLFGRFHLGALLPILLMQSNRLRREHLELRPDGLCLEINSWLSTKQRTLPWAPMSNMQEEASGGVRFSCEHAPFLGTTFRIGQNLTPEETHAFITLVREYRALHSAAPENGAR